MIIFQFLKYQLSLRNFLSFLIASEKKKVKSKAKLKFKTFLKKKKHQNICISKC